MLANPELGLRAIRKLLQAKLGEALVAAQNNLGIVDGVDSDQWARHTLQPKGWARCNVAGDTGAPPPRIAIELVSAPTVAEEASYPLRRVGGS